MFGNITDLPVLHSYAEAVAHYESITPIRGSKNLRPICATTNGRRKKHMQIIKTTHPKALGVAATPEGALDAVACRLYDTDVVTFVSNGDIIIDNGGYASTTTHSFIDGIFTRSYYSRPVCAYTKGGCTVIEVNPTGNPANRKIKLLTEGTVTIRCKEPSPTAAAFDFVGEPPMYGYYLKRAPMGMRRKEVEKFRKFALACAKMIDPEQYRVAHYRSPAAMEASYVYAAMTDQERWNDAFELLIPHAIHLTWGYTAGNGNLGHSHRVVAADPDRLKRLMDDVLKYVFCDDLFEKRETNNPLSNENGKYMVGGEGLVL